MEKIFQSNDELRAVNPAWDIATMRAQKGLFFLADVRRKFQISDKWITSILDAYRDRPEELKQRFGIRRVFHRYLVHMDIFVSYLDMFDARFMTHEIPSTWTPEQLLASTYVYRLGDVARALGKSSLSLLYVHKFTQADNAAFRKSDVGLHAHYNGGWLVDMVKFAPFYHARTRFGGGKSQRPKAYVELVQTLDDHVLYSPAMIASRAVEKESGDERNQCYARVYAVMSSYARRHHFPKEGDGKLEDGTLAWTGELWKATYGRG